MHPQIGDETPTWFRGAWMQTYTGKKFYPLDPAVADIDILDIAHALAMTCRYGGHCKQFYSVAQHSVLVASKAAPHNALRALLHDAAEAYIGDLIRPIKKHPEMSAFLWAEELVERAICAKFNLPYPLVNTEVKRLDDRILSDERDQVMTHMHCPDDEWGNLHEPLGVTIRQWAPEMARAKFLTAFEIYSRWEDMIPKGDAA